MAKKSRVNKTQAVYEFLKNHPQASPLEISEGLKLEGIAITPGHASNIKSRLKKLRLAKKLDETTVAATSAADLQAATVGGEQELSSGAGITLNQIRKVAQMVRDLGGFDRLNEMLEVVREVGGLRRFRDLLEAMRVMESDSP